MGEVASGRTGTWKGVGGRSRWNGQLGRRRGGGKERGLPRDRGRRPRTRVCLGAVAAARMPRAGPCRSLGARALRRDSIGEVRTRHLRQSQQRSEPGVSGTPRGGRPSSLPSGLTITPQPWDVPAGTRSGTGSSLLPVSGGGRVVQRTQPLCVPRGRCPRRPRSRSGAGQAARPAGPGIQGPGRPAAQTDGDGLSGPTGRSKIVSGPQGPAGDVAGSWPEWAGLALPGRHGPAWPRAAFGGWPWPPGLGPSAAPKQGPGPRRDPALSALGMGVPRVWGPVYRARGMGPRSFRRESRLAQLANSRALRAGPGRAAGAQAPVPPLPGCVTS